MYLRKHATPKHTQLKFAFISQGMTKISVRGDRLFSWQARIHFKSTARRLQQLEGDCFHFACLEKHGFACFGK